MIPQRSVVTKMVCAAKILWYGFLRLLAAHAIKELTESIRDVQKEQFNDGGRDVEFMLDCDLKIYRITEEIKRNRRLLENYTLKMDQAFFETA